MGHLFAGFFKASGRQSESSTDGQSNTLVEPGGYSTGNDPLPRMIVRTVQTDDHVRLRVETSHSRDDGVTLIFVHGIASSLQEFDDQRTALSSHANLVLYDQRGHGGSDAGRPGDVTLPRLAQDLASVIAETTAPQDPVILVAHSLGGMVALSLITQEPELVGTKIAGITLISTAAERIPAAATSPAVAAALLRTRAAHGLLNIAAWCAPALDRLKPALTLPGRWWLRYTMFGRPRPPAGLLKAKQTLWAHTPAAVVASAYRSLLTFDSTPALEALRRTSVLLITGTDDRTIPAGRSERLASMVGASATLLTVQGAGHCVNQTNAPAVNEAINDLLARIRP